MAAKPDSHGGLAGVPESAPPPDFRQTTINTHISSTGYNLDKDPLHVDDTLDKPESPVAEFFGSLKALFYRDLSFDALSIVLILVIMCVAFWVGAKMVRVLNSYGERIAEPKSSRAWESDRH